MGPAASLSLHHVFGIKGLAQTPAQLSDRSLCATKTVAALGLHHAGRRRIAPRVCGCHFIDLATVSPHVRPHVYALLECYQKTQGKWQYAGMFAPEMEELHEALFAESESSRPAEVRASTLVRVQDHRCGGGGSTSSTRSNTSSINCSSCTTCGRRRRRCRGRRSAPSCCESVAPLRCPSRV